MSENETKTEGYDEIVALRLLDEAERAARWMENTATTLQTMIRTDPKLAGKIEAYVLTKRINDTLEEARKVVGAVVQEASYSIIPEKMSDEGMTSVNSASGYRVTMSSRFSCSMIDKDAGFEWLRENGLGDLIVPTVNAQTLSAQARRLVEEENMDLPEDIFKTSVAANVSVTKIKAK